MGAYNNILVAVIGSLLAAKLQCAQVLTSEPSGPFCQGPVTFTCRGTDSPFIFNWVLNGSVITTYLFSRSDTYPLLLNPMAGSFPPGVTIEVDNAALGSQSSINITSTLMVSNVSTLNGSSLSCGDPGGGSSNVLNVMVNSKDPPSPPDFECLLRPSPGGLQVVLQSISSFNAQEYNVSISPDPSSCSNNQVPSNVNYSCSGLNRMGTSYFVAISAINCAGQEGVSVNNNLQPHLLVPQLPSEVRAMSAGSKQLSINWQESIAESGNCLLAGGINYTLILEDDKRTITNFTTGSDVCDNEDCTIVLTISSQICSVGIVATNDFGSSDMASTNIVPSRLTQTNIALLVIGVLLLVGILVVLILLVIFSYVHSNSKASIILLLCGIILIVVAMFWVAVGFQVGLQDDTCNEGWQNSRDGLISSSFAISVITVLIVGTICTIIVFAIILKRNKGQMDLNGNPDGNEDESEHRNLTETKPDAYERMQKESEQTYSKTQFDATVGPPPPPVDGLYSTHGRPTESGAYDVPKQPNKPDVKPAPATIPGNYAILDNEVCTCNEEPWVPCISMRMHNRVCRKVDPPIPLEEVAEWFPEHRRWDVKDKAVDHLLVVFLMNDCPSDWKYNEDVITCNLFMEILNDTWRHHFILGPQEAAHIRVEFQGDAMGSRSVLGTFAKYIPETKPTMILNFSNMNSEMIKATILHQFGHALGLGHALMKPEDWEWLRPHVNLTAMMAFYGSPSLEAFEVQWTGKGLSGDVVNYDEGSIMQYSTDMSWIPKRALGRIDRKKLDIFRKHATTLKIKPTSNDLTTLNIIGCPDISVDCLIYLGNKQAGTEVRITRKLADVWYTIGQKLGVKKEKLEAVRESTDYTNDERLKEVWNLWLNNTDELIYRKKYPPSWEGFRKLLKNIGKQDVADQFFEFLYKL